MEEDQAINAIENSYEYAIDELNRSQGDERRVQYLKSYPSLLEGSQILCTKARANPGFRKQTIVAIAHMAYGWMPTMLMNCDINDENANFILRAVNVNSSEEAIKFVFEFSNSPINNSWVGLSKTLHFIKPKFFPIWDSKVAKVFGKQNQMSNRNLFREYVKLCHSISPKVSAPVEKVKEHFQETVGYDVTDIRALEFILYSAGKNENS